MYANGWFPGAKTVEEFANAAKAVREKGIKAIKFDPFGKAYMHLERSEFNAAIEKLEAVRGAVGNDVEILVEGHGRFDIATGIKIANAIKPYDPFFFEEPTPPDSFDAIAEVRRKSPVPIAGGERVYSLMHMREYLDKGCADFVQPELSHCGGISAVKKMAAMAETYYVNVAPHNPSGPVANAATLNLAGCIRNFRILEIMLTDVSWRKELTNEHVVFNNGCIQIPNGPGLGLELNEEACMRYPFQPINLRHYNNTLTDVRPADSCTYFENF